MSYRNPRSILRDVYCPSLPIEDSLTTVIDDITIGCPGKAAISGVADTLRGSHCEKAAAGNGQIKLITGILHTALTQIGNDFRRLGTEAEISYHGRNGISHMELLNTGNIPIGVIIIYAANKHGAEFLVHYSVPLEAGGSCIRQIIGNNGGAIHLGHHADARRI